MKTAWLAPVALLAATIAGPAAARAEVIGMDAAACTNREGPAILANIVGLKDRKGRLKLELYPANEDDFLKDDRDLVAQGKTFRRVWVQTPPAGAVDICIRVPHPGRYALFATHDRDGKNKFNFFQDGAGIDHAVAIGRGGAATQSSKRRSRNGPARFMLRRRAPPPAGVCRANTSRSAVR